MLRKLALFSNGLIEEDDRDAFSNKSIDSPGIMLANLFRQSFTRMIKDSNVNINRETNSGSWKLTSNFHNIINKKNVCWRINHFIETDNVWMCTQVQNINFSLHFLFHAKLLNLGLIQNFYCDFMPCHRMSR